MSLDHDGREFDPLEELIRDLKPNLARDIGLSMKMSWILVNNRGSGTVAMNLLRYIFIFELKKVKNMKDVKTLIANLKKERKPYDI